MSFKIIKKDLLEYKGEEVKVLNVFGSNSVEIESFNGMRKLVKPSELKSLSGSLNKALEPSISKETSKESEILKDALERYLKSNNKEETRNLLLAELELTQATFYRYLKVYKTYNSVYPIFKSKVKQVRKKRISPRVEEIIDRVINDYYLTNQKVKLIHAIKQVKLECKSKDINPPHENTIRNRVKELDHKKKVKSRNGSKHYAEKYQLIRDKYPETSCILQNVQIDHGVINVILVDENNREITKRPWITVAIDVHSRVILGYHLTYKSPSYLSVGLCITNAILDKDQLLDKFNLDFEWPFYGMIHNIHCDNAKEFSGLQLENACAEYSINLNLRPIGKPQYGGHIERLIGTLKSDMVMISGTTGHDKSHRENYSSERMASMTIKELEKWILLDIIGVYHQSIHKGINTTPAKAWENSVMGDENNVGVGLPLYCENEEKLKLDFLPSFTRTIQRAGVLYNHIAYRSDAFRGWVGMKNPERNNFEFDFKIDHRDLSRIFFWDPNLKQYFEVSYANRGNAPITLWDMKRAKAKLKQEKRQVDEDTIFKAYGMMKKIEEEAIISTKKVRRSRSSRKPKNNFLGNNSIDKTEIDYSNLKPFNEI